MSYNQNLKREIGAISLIAYYFSTIVGVGIFVVPVFAARVAGPASILSWLMVLLIAFPFAYIFAHISQKYQVSGSIQKFIEQAAGFKFGKSMALFLICTALFGNCLLGFTGAGYVVELFDIKGSNQLYIIGFGLLVISALFNLLQIGVSSRIQTLSLIVLVLFVEFIVFTSVPNFNFENLEPFMPNGWNSIFVAAVICFYSVVGWENVDAIAEEVKNPVSSYKHAIKYSLILIALFYLSIVATVILVMTPEQIANKNAIMSVLLNVNFGAHFGKAGAIISIFLLFLGMNVWILGTSRLIFALSRDKILPECLSIVSKKNNIPVMAVLSQLVVYALIAITMTALEAKDDIIVEIASLNYLLLYSVIFFCGAKLFSTKRLKLLSSVALIVSMIFLLQSSNSNIAVSIVIAIFCFIYVYFFKHRHKAL
jgi:amino acid efflux transporter